MKPLVFKILFALGISLFAFFPLTDTDIWWHLAAARDFLENGLAETDPFCWTPSRSPWINVHLFFQLAVYFVINHFGALGLVFFKSLAWGVVAFLWVLPVKRRVRFFEFSVSLCLAFPFRFFFECRPLFFTMLFLGIFWNLLPAIAKKFSVGWFVSALAMLVVEWIWVRSQGLFPLGFALSFLIVAFFWKRMPASGKWGSAAFLVLLFSVPLWHLRGNFLWIYPFGLLDRLLGGSSAARMFASEIAENRSPFSLVWNGENVFPMLVLIFLVAVSLARVFSRGNFKSVRNVWIFVAAVLALSAERNLPLFLFPFVWSLWNRSPFDGLLSRFRVKGKIPGILLLAFTLGFFARSVPAYIRNGTFSAVSRERVPAGAVSFMKENPLPTGVRLFNDDRSGGYLEWNLRGVKTFVDGRFILKDSAFFASYLGYARNPGSFFSDAESLSIGRVLLPIRYFTMWEGLAREIAVHVDWKVVYVDDFYVVLDRTRFNF